MMFTIRGIPTAGIAVGTAFVLQRRASAAATAAAGDPVAEAGRFHAALERAKAELSALAEGEAVFAAHLEMAGDPMLAGLVEGRIAEKHLSAGQALGEACEEVCGMFAALDDDYLRGRTDDVRDVCARIRRVLSGETAHDPFAGLAPGTIVVADELAPSDTAQMDFSRVAGLVTAHGSVTSHVAIIARNKGIAALVGVAGCMRQVRTGDRLIIDGERGELIVDPDPATGRKYAARLESLRQDAFRCAADAQAPAVTPAGRRITVLGNAANVDEVRRALDAGAEGIGLFRSEFLYMQGPALPDEETQFAAYRAAAELCGARPLTVRTLDIGGDKALRAGGKPVSGMACDPGFAGHAGAVPHPAAGIATRERIRQRAGDVPDDSFGRGVPRRQSGCRDLHGGTRRRRGCLRPRHSAGGDDRDPGRRIHRRRTGCPGAVFQHRHQRPDAVRDGRRPWKPPRSLPLRRIRPGRATQHRHGARRRAPGGYRSRDVRRTGCRPARHGELSVGPLAIAPLKHRIRTDK